VVVTKFEALFRCWCVETEEYRDKFWSRGQNSISQQTAYKTLTQSVAGAGGISVQWVLLASCTAVCVCVCVRAFQLQVNITGAEVVAQMGLRIGTYGVLV